MDLFDTYTKNMVLFAILPFRHVSTRIILLVSYNIFRHDIKSTGQRSILQTAEGIVQTSVFPLQKRRPPSLAQLQAMFGPIQESAFYVTYRMRVLSFRELLIYLERQFAGLTQTQRGSCSLLRCFLDVPSLSDNKIR